MSNLGPFDSHSLNLVYNVFTQFISALKLTKTFTSFQLSLFFICTSSMIQSSCCNTLGATIAAMIAALRGFLKIYYFSVLIHSQNLYKTRMSFSSLLKYTPSDDINNIQCYSYSGFYVSANCVLIILWKSIYLTSAVWVPVFNFRIMLFKSMWFLNYSIKFL